MRFQGSRPKTQTFFPSSQQEAVPKALQEMRLTCRAQYLSSALVGLTLPSVTRPPPCRRYKRAHTVAMSALTVLAGTGTNPALEGCCTRASPLRTLKLGKIKVWHRAALASGQLCAYGESLEYQ